jgi:hypothetical protein
MAKGRAEYSHAGPDQNAGVKCVRYGGCKGGMVAGDLDKQMLGRRRKVLVWDGDTPSHP